MIEMGVDNNRLFTFLLNNLCQLCTKLRRPEFVDVTQVIMAPPLPAGVKPKVCKMTQC